MDTASDAFEVWKTWTGSRRAKCLLKLADLIEANCERLARLETMAMGQPFIAAREFIRTSVAEWFRYYAGWCTKLGGEYYPDDDGQGFYKIVTYEPLGVCAAVVSWNATFLYAAWKIAPAVAAGNTVILKPSERSPLGALALGDLIKEAGFPPGVINILSGEAWTGFLLAAHKRVAKVSFTGSHTNGKRIHVAATHTNMKRITLELGGKNPSIVFEDADFGNALHHNSYGFLLNTGQACVSGSRLFVHEDIADGFIEGLVACFKTFTTIMGNPMEPNTLLGPLVDKRHFDRVMYYIAEGQKDGAQLLCGGVRKGDKGWFLEPAILLNPPMESCVYRDEIFGPVLIVRTFKTEEEVIEMANDTMYGLSGKNKDNSTAVIPHHIPQTLTDKSQHLYQRLHPRHAYQLTARSWHREHQQLHYAHNEHSIRRLEAERFRARVWKAWTHGVFGAEDYFDRVSSIIPRN